MVGQREVDRELRLERRGPQRRHRAVDQALEHPLAVAAHQAVHVAAVAHFALLGQRHRHERTLAAKSGIEDPRVPPIADGEEHVRARRLGFRRHEQHARRVRDGLDAERAQRRLEERRRARSNSRRAWR